MTYNQVSWLLALSCLLFATPTLSQTSCAAPYVLAPASLPFVSPLISTPGNFDLCGLNDNYTSTSPGACGSSYENGPEFVMEFTATSTICLDVRSFTTHTGGVALFIYDGCPDLPTSKCREYDVSGNPKEVLGITIPAGETNYFMWSMQNGNCTQFRVEINESVGGIGSDFCNAHLVDNDSIPFQRAITTCGAVDNWDQNSLAMANCASNCNYAQDEDYLFEYHHPIPGTLTVDIVDGTVDNGRDPGIYVFNGSPDLATTTLVAQATHNNSSSTNLGAHMVKSNLAAGIYYILVGTKGTPNCTPMEVTIDGPASTPPTIDAASIVDASCGTNTGSITANPSGGLPPYTYQWNAAAGNQTTAMATGLAAGSYAVTVSGNNGLSNQNSFVVGVAPAFTLTTSSTGNTCPLDDGTATASVVGGTTPLTFLWDSGTGNQNTATATGLTTGTYTVTVIDANGCSATDAAVVDVLSNVVTVSESILPPTCSNIADGSIDLTITSGTATTYEWSNGATTQNLSNLTGGQYCVTVNGSCGGSQRASVFGNIFHTAVREAHYNASEDAYYCVGEHGIGVEYRGFFARIARDGTPTWEKDFFNGDDIYSMCPATNNEYLIAGATGNEFRIYRMDTSGNLVWSQSYSTGFTAPEQPRLVKGTGDNYYLAGWDAGNKAVVMRIGGTGTVQWLKNFDYADTQTLDAQPDGNGGLLIAGGSHSGLIRGFFIHVDATGAQVGGKLLTVSGKASEFQKIIKANDGGYIVAGVIGNSLTNADGFLLKLSSTYAVEWDQYFTAQTSARVSGLSEDASGTIYVNYNTELAGGAEQSTIFKFSDTGQPLLASSWDYAVHSRIASEQLPNGNLFVYGPVANHPDAPNPYASMVAEVSPELNACSTTPVSITTLSTTYTYSNWTFATATLSTTANSFTAAALTANYTGAVSCEEANVFCFDVVNPPNFSMGGVITNTCPGQSTGGFDFHTNNGTTPFSFVWSNGATTLDIQNIGVGTYTVTATDANGCTATQGGTVGHKQVATVVMNNATAACSNDGAASASVSGGFSTYSFLWDAGAGSQTSSTATGLTLGNTYTVTVNTNVGCTTSASITLPAPSTISVGFTANNATCGSPDGSLTAAGSGGTAPYTYAWEAAAGSQSTATATGLTPGNYTVSVSDATGGCTTASGNVGGTSSPLSATIDVQVDPVCSYDNGLAAAIPSNGVGPYSYQWNYDGGNSTSVFANISGLPYYLAVTVTDGNGCTASATSVNSMSPIYMPMTLASTNVSCPGNMDGTVTVTMGALAPAGPFTYFHVNSAGSSNQATNNFTGLPAGSNTFYVVHSSSGCYSSAQNLSIGDDGPQLSLTETPAFCGSATGEATVAATGPYTPFTYAWNDGASQTTASATGLIAGTYPVTVTDANGCEAVDAVDVTSINPLTSSISTTPATCTTADGTATISVLAATLPLSYSWSGVTGQTTATVTGLSPELYSVTSTDANGCTTTASANVHKTIGAPITLTTSITNDACGVPGEVDLGVTGGSAPYTYAWSDGSTAQDIASAAPGTYCVTVTDACNLPAGNTFVYTGSGTQEISLIDHVYHPGLDAHFGIGQTKANSSAAAQAVFVRLERDGTVASATIHDNFEGINSLCAATNNEFIAASVDGELGFRRIDANGNVLWSKQFSASSTTPSLPTIVKGIGDNYFVATGANSSGSTVAKIDGTGTVLWRFGRFGGGIKTRDLVARPDGGVTVVGSRFTSNYSGTQRGLIYELDASGGLLNAKAVAIPNEHVVFSNVLLTGTGEYILTGWSGLSSARQGIVYRLDANLDLVWAREFETPGTHDHNEFFGGTHGLVQNAAGTIFITQNVDDGSGTTQSNLYRYTDAGVLLDARMLPHFQNAQLGQELLPDGSAIAWARAFNHPQAGIATSTGILEIPADGNACSAALVPATDAAASGTLQPTGFYSTSNYQFHPQPNNVAATTSALSLATQLACSGTQTICAIVGTGGSLGASISVTPQTCATFQDGSATATPSGGTAPYTYVWSHNGGSGSTQTLTNMPSPNSYNVTITDATGCTGTASFTDSNTPSDPSVQSVSHTDVSCAGESNGTITVTAAGGSGFWTHTVWNNLSGAITQLPNHFTGLADGNYQVWVEDINQTGCISPPTFVTIGTSGSAVTASINGTTSTCSGADGTATVGVTSGTAPFTYAWSDPFNQTTATATGLASGTYTVTVSDNNGCTATASGTVTSTVITVSTATVDACGAASNGAIDITVSGGNTPYSYNWSHGSSAADQSGIGAGTYTVTVTDAGGCAATQTATINSTTGNFDDMPCAQEITNITGYCSGNAAFSTGGATPDEAAASCWPSGPNNNVWFSFVATGATVNLQLKTGSTEGTLKYPMLALWESSTVELGCVAFTSAYSDLSLSVGGLVSGKTYYIAVDNAPGGAGSFTICADDVVNYDFLAGAEDLTGLNGCAPASYSTLGATPDQSAGSCWPSGPNNNRWFSFTASGNFLTAQLFTGSIKYPMMALYDASLTEIGCASFTNANSNLAISSATLVPGNTYYLSVDNAPSGAGTFTLCVFDTPSPDFQAGAVALPSTTGYCSADAAFNTHGATGDASAGSCWYTGPNHNIWFSFVAGQTNISIDLETGGSKGTLQYPMMALFDAGGTELGCAVFQSSYQDLSIPYNSLTPGNTYYIAVDNAPGSTGSFTLCLNDAIDYDFVGGAEPITNFNNWCSAPGQYSTVGGSPDGTAGTCWPTGPQYNRWFEFTAPANDLIIRLRTLSSYGTMRYPMLAVYDASMTQIGCHSFSNGSTQAVWYQSTGFVPGATYFIQVDNAGSSTSQGTFTICIDDLTGSSAKRTDVDSRATPLGMEAPGVRIVPNPAAYSTSVQLDAPLANDATIHIIDITGKIVGVQPLRAGQQNAPLALDRLAAGLYLVEITNSDHRLVRRLVVE